MIHYSTFSNPRFAKRISKRNVRSHSSNKLKLKLSKSATSQSRRYVTAKDQRNVELFMNHLVPPSTSKSNQVNLLETPPVKSCQ